MPEELLQRTCGRALRRAARAHVRIEAVGPAVDFLAGVAGQGAALELGIGTGRIALPLHGAASTSTASSSRRTWSSNCAHGGPTTSRSRSETSPRPGSTASSRSLTSSSTRSTTYDARRAGRLLPERRQPLQAGGCFVIEVGVPSLRRLPYGETFRAFDVRRHVSALTSSTSRTRARLPPLPGGR